MWRKERCLKHSDYLAELTSSYESKKDEEIAPKRKGVKWEKYFRKNLERGRSIEAAVVNRCTERERFLVFCAARHPRLGAFSPARVLPKDCMRVIWKAMANTDRLVVVGTALYEVDEPYAYCLSFQTMEWSSLPPPPFAFVRPCVVPLDIESFLVFGGSLGNTPLRKAAIFRDNRWKVVSFPGLDRLGLTPASGLMYKKKLIVKKKMILGGTTQNISRSSGLPDIMVNLETKDVRYLPYRPNFQTFFDVQKSFIAGSWLIVFSRACYCLNVGGEEDTRHWNFERPYDPRECCNQFIALNLEDEGKGWFELPWLSSCHIYSTSLYFEGTNLILYEGCDSQVYCPCCGPEAQQNPNVYYLDFGQLTEKPFWRFYRDEKEMVIDGPRTWNTHTLDSVQGVVFVGGVSWCTNIEDGSSHNEHVREIFINNDLIAKFNTRITNASDPEKQNFQESDFDPSAPFARGEHGFAIVSWRT